MHPIPPGSGRSKSPESFSNTVISFCSQSTSVTRISALGSHVFANIHGINCRITKPQCTYVSGWIMANITNNQPVVEIVRSYHAYHPSMYVLYRIGPMQTIEWFSWALVWGGAYNIKVSINIGLAHDHCSTWVSGFKSSCSCFCMPPFLHKYIVAE